MTRRRAKTDANQYEIVTALREAGATVQSLAEVGAGCPDLLVGVGHRNLLLEVKDGSLPPSKRKPTRDQQNWIATWRGQVQVVNGVDEALKAVFG